MAGQRSKPGEQAKLPLWEQHSSGAPKVPQGKARIRTQISAAHSEADLAFAIEQFAEAKSELGL